MPTASWSCGKDGTRRWEPTASCWQVGDTTRSWWRASARDFSRSPPAPRGGRPRRLGALEGREGRHVGHPETGQAALLVHLDVEAVGGAHDLDRAPPPSPEMEYAFRRIGLDRERGIDLHR